MATPLDFAAIQQFQGVFAFLFTLVMVYAILGYTEFFKDKKWLLAVISFLLAFMALANDIIIKSINLMAPWLVLFMIFILIMTLGFMMLGLKQDKILEALNEDKFGIGTWMAVILIVIAAGSVLSVWTEKTGGLETLKGYNESNFVSGHYPVENLFQTLFHPKFLGFVLVMVIAIFTLKYMTEETK